MSHIRFEPITFYWQKHNGVISKPYMLQGKLEWVSNMVDLILNRLAKEHSQERKWFMQDGSFFPWGELKLNSYSKCNHKAFSDGRKRSNHKLVFMINYCKKKKKKGCMYQCICICLPFKYEFSFRESLAFLVSCPLIWTFLLNVQNRCLRLSRAKMN